MEKLKSYLRSLPTDEAREEFARRCGTTLGYLRNVASGFRILGAEGCVVLERESGFAVTRQDLRPHDWRRIWPELAAAADKALA